MMKAAKLIGEDTFKGAGAGRFLSPADAQAQINAIYANSTHAYHHRGVPGHDEAVQEMRRLFEQLHPQEGATR